MKLSKKAKRNARKFLTMRKSMLGKFIQFDLNFLPEKDFPAAEIREMINNAPITFLREGQLIKESSGNYDSEKKSAYLVDEAGQWPSPKTKEFWDHWATIQTKQHIK